AEPSRRATIVPAGVTTGPITGTAPAGSATSSRVFRVLGDVAIAPETATVRVTGHATFAATDAGVRITSVPWAVNGLPGGDPALGTISADGVYTAPPQIPGPAGVIVTATHEEDASLSASAT